MEWTSIVGCAHDADVTVGDQSSNARAITIQLKDYAGNDLEERASIIAYISGASGGDALCTTAFDTFEVDGDGVVIKTLTTGTIIQLVSESDGDIGLTIEDTQARTGYLNLIMPDGRLVKGGAVTMT